MAAAIGQLDSDDNAAFAFAFAFASRPLGALLGFEDQRLKMT
jgi:hypothetical protein